MTQPAKNVQTVVLKLRCRSND